jgi:hypothetical protein
MRERTGLRPTLAGQGVVLGRQRSFRPTLAGQGIVLAIGCQRSFRPTLAGQGITLFVLYRLLICGPLISVGIATG